MYELLVGRVKSFQAHLPNEESVLVKASVVGGEKVLQLLEEELGARSSPKSTNAIGEFLLGLIILNLPFASFPLLQQVKWPPLEQVEDT
ncbi:hypothetical protein CYMTET_28221 [Cymbomonas tetramitiformis]|uniref:Uncharacterized protein n=1 Tax=Cymbomonas tetramitiformis TaxID=36881 RepID=A0AAE0KW58_9CHLO|nr:hypothetical protein CYMTET_28221 [Cymbomonas tetramitiformis]